MALWGNKDAGIGTAPAPHATTATLSLDYYTKKLIGTATKFGTAGAAKTGDVLIIGDRTSGTYFGEAVIAGIGSTTVVTIGSTAGLNGAAISNVAVWKVKESPVYTAVDAGIGGTSGFGQASSLTYLPYKVYNDKAVAVAETCAGAGSVVGWGVSVISVTEADIDENTGAGIKVGDYFDTNTGPKVITATNKFTGTALTAVGVGETVLRFCPGPGMAANGIGQHVIVTSQYAGDTVNISGFGQTTLVAKVGQGATTNYVTIDNLAAHNILPGDTMLTPVIATAVAIGTVNAGVNTVSLVAGKSSGTITAGMAITFFSNTIVTMSTGVSTAIAVGSAITVVGNSTCSYVSLGATIDAAVSAGAAISIARYQGGRDAYVYGISTAGSQEASGTQYETGVGWVGVQTYVDNGGNLRVKKEILAELSGITTEDRAAFPAYPNVRQQA